MRSITVVSFAVLTVVSFAVLLPSCVFRISRGSRTQPALEAGAGAGVASRAGDLMSIRPVILSIAVFFLAGLCEIGGGWLIWRAVREKQPRWWILPGALLLVAYGFVQPGLLPDVSSAEFGRAFAVYGGVFIAMSLGWAAALDGFEPDAGDYAGACVVLVGVAIMWWYPRGQ